MTTVVDPLGTPTVIYNRSGTAIVTITGGLVTGSDEYSATADNAVEIPRVSEVTVALITTSHPTSNTWYVAVKLPSNAEIGDVVEVHRASGSDSLPYVFPPVGEAMFDRVASTGTDSNSAFGVNSSGWMIYRKVSTSLWMPIG